MEEGRLREPDGPVYPPAPAGAYLKSCTVQTRPLGVT
jgi:hypothetical protein